jgi:hypothetical protein
MSRLTPIMRLCSACRQRIPLDARVCPNCKAPQRKWGELISFSSTNLALLVALISVATPLLSLLLNYLKPPGSDVQLLFESMTYNEVTFLVRNEGRSGGVLRLDSLNMLAKSSDDDAGVSVNVQLAPNSSYIEPGREQRISAQVVASLTGSICQQFDEYIDRVRDKLVQTLGNLHGAAYEHRFIPALRENLREGLSCGFKVRETSFNSQDRGERTFKVECFSISFISTCLEPQ